jgi:phosphomannomutase/phosphoglucomutase
VKLPTVITRIAKISVLLPTTATVLLAIIGANSLYQIQVIEPWQENILARVNSDAETAANAVSTFIMKLTDPLNEAARGVPLITALESDNDKLIIEAQYELLKKWPVNGDILLLRRAADYLDSSENFVALDLLRKSSAGETPRPSAVRLDDVWTVFIAIPVIRDKGNDAIAGEIAGNLLVNFPISAISGRLSEHLESAQIAIRQTSDNFQPLTIFSRGSSSSELNTTVPIKAVPGWMLSYAAPESLPEDVAKSIKSFLASLSGIMLFTLAVIGLIIRYADWLTVQISRLTKRPDEATVEEGDIPPDELDKLISEKLIRREKADQLIETAPETDTSDAKDPFSDEVFRSYDIRGDTKTQITPLFAEALGKTLGTRVILDSPTTMLVAADGRTTSPTLRAALVKGILSTGCDVVDIGCNPTPVFNFGIQNLTSVSSGVVITASHNPAGDNGFKIIIDNNVLTPSEITQLAEAMRLEDWAQGSGKYSEQDVIEAYNKAILENISINKPLNVVVDCGNGAMAAIAPRLLSSLGCQVTPLYCDIDGNFPNHPPDPSEPANLQDLITTVQHDNADLGLAFDGDGDRLVAVSGSGRIIWPDELMMIFSRDLLTKQPDSTIVFDVKSTRRLAELINSYGGTPVMCRTGHSNIRRELQANNAPLAGEYSGHIFFGDRWFGFDDGLYAAARLVEIIDLREQSLDEIVSSFEIMVATHEIRVPVTDDKKFDIVEQISSNAIFSGGTLNKMDGLRVDFDKGWGLVRASNTSASLTLRFEAISEEALEEVQQLFKDQITEIVPEITLPW